VKPENEKLLARMFFVLAPSIFWGGVVAFVAHPIMGFLVFTAFCMLGLDITQDDFKS